MRIVLIRTNKSNNKFEHQQILINITFIVNSIGRPILSRLLTRYELQHCTCTNFIRRWSMDEHRTCEQNIYFPFLVDTVECQLTSTNCIHIKLTVGINLHFNLYICSTSDFYQNVEKKMRRSFLSVIVCWRRFSIRKLGINILHRCIR